MSLKNIANISIKFLGSCFVCSPCSRIVLVTKDDQRSKQFKENVNMNKVTPHIHRKCDISDIFIEDQLMQYMMRDQSNWIFVEIINKTENFKVYIHIEIMTPRDLLPLKKGWSEIHAKSSNYLKDWSIIQGSFIWVVSLCHPILIPFLWESNELVSFYAFVVCLGLHDFIITIWDHILFMTILDASLYDILMCLLTISCIWYISCRFTFYFSHDMFAWLWLTLLFTFLKAISHVMHCYFEFLSWHVDLRVFLFHIFCHVIEWTCV
jgi:hypothetical protein